MSLSREQVGKIAHLARLGVEESDFPKYAEELSRILGLVEQMQEADTAGIEPMAHPLNAVQRLRADEVTENDQRDRFQRIAPATEDGLYLVPQVIE